MELLALELFLVICILGVEVSTQVVPEVLNGPVTQTVPETQSEAQFTCHARASAIFWYINGETLFNTIPNWIILYDDTHDFVNVEVTRQIGVITQGHNGTKIECLATGSNQATDRSAPAFLYTVALPSPPNGFSYSIPSSSANEVSVTVDWDPPTAFCNRDNVTYTVTISPPAQLSATVLTSTSFTMTAQYNVDYNISVVATNCAGSSATAMYNFSIEGCLVLTDPMNGLFGLVSNRLPGSMVTIQCVAGYVSAIKMVTCEDTLMWSPDLEGIECTSLTQPPPTTPPSMNCTVPLPSPQNGTISDHSVPAIPGTQVTFQCNDGLFPEGLLTATCLDTGEWDNKSGEIVCRRESISCVLPAPPLNGVLLNTNNQNTNQTEGSVITFQCGLGFSLVGAATATCNNSGLWYPDPALLECVEVTSGSIAAVAGGVVGGVFVVALIVMVLIVLLVSLVNKGKHSQLSDNELLKAPSGSVHEEVGLAMSPKVQEIQLESNNKKQTENLYIQSQ